MRRDWFIILYEINEFREQIKKISSQIKDITNMLVEETKKQGEELSN